jgi:hypothetical protein|nr:MAG TPA: hypothetical protein [Caudoviricetes sp.]
MEILNSEKELIYRKLVELSVDILCDHRKKDLVRFREALDVANGIPSLDQGALNHLESIVEGDADYVFCIFDDATDREKAIADILREIGH